MIRPRSLALPLLVLIGLGGRARAETRFDDAHRPSEDLLWTYIEPRNRPSIPPDQVAALEAYLAHRDVKAASAAELQALYVKQPPSDETLKSLTNPGTGPAVPENVKAAIFGYLYAKPMDKMTEAELRYEIKSQEAAQAKNRDPAYDDGLRRLRSALAAKTGSAASGTTPPVRPQTASDFGKTLLLGGVAGANTASAPSVAPPGADASASLSSLGVPGPSGGTGSNGAAGGDESAGRFQAALEGNAGKTDAAKKRGDELKSAFEDGREAAGGPGGPGGAPKTGGSDPSDPKTTRDLALASATGFKRSFDALGLKVVSGAVVDGSGKPASPDQLARLKDAIRSEPTALMRFPDFYAQISPRRFAELKSDIVSRPELSDTAFRHIALSSSGRDIVRSQSCELLSGRCNPSTVSSSYKKGEDVPPGDLRVISDGLHPAEEEDRDEPRDGRFEERLQTEAKMRGGGRKIDTKTLYARVNDAIRGFRRMLAGEGGGAGSASASSPVSAGGGFATSASPRDPREAAAGSGFSANVRTAAPDVPAPTADAAGRPRTRTMVFAGIFLALAAFAIYRRNSGS